MHEGLKHGSEKLRYGIANRPLACIIPETWNPGKREYLRHTAGQASSANDQRPGLAPRRKKRGHDSSSYLSAAYAHIRSHGIKEIEVSTTAGVDPTGQPMG